MHREHRCCAQESTTGRASPGFLRTTVAWAALALWGCLASGTPGTFHVTFVWPDGPPTFSQPVYVFAEVDDQSVAPSAILQLAGPVEYTGGAITLPFTSVSNGSGRVVVIQIQQTSSSSSQVYYYGKSSPFSIKPGSDVDVPVSLMLQLAPGAMPPGVDAGTAASAIEIVSPVTPGYVGCGPQPVPAQCPVQLTLTTATGVSVKLANELGGVDGATPQPISATGAGGSRATVTGWDLNAGLSATTVAACDVKTAQQGCPRTVYAEFVDKNGFVSPVVFAQVTLDAVPPGFANAGTAIPMIAGLGQVETLTVTANEPLLPSPVPTLALTGPVQLTFSSTGAGTTFTYSASIPAADPNGLYTGSYTDTLAMTDLAGNKATLTGPAFAVDTSSPLVGTLVNGMLQVATVLTENAAGQSETQFSMASGYDDLVIVFDVSKPVGPPAVSVGSLILPASACAATPAGSNHYLCDHPVSGTEPETSVSISVKVTDTANNSGEASAAVTFDFTAPSLLLPLGAQPSIVGAGQLEVLTLTPSEPLQPGFPRVAFAGPLTLPTQTGTALELTLPTSPAVQGLETTSVQLVDLAGNPATVAGPAFTVDTIVPAFSALTASGGYAGVAGAVFSECGTAAPIPAECDPRGAAAYNLVSVTFTADKLLTTTGNPPQLSVVVGNSPMACQLDADQAGFQYTCTYTVSPADESGQKTVAVLATDEAGNLSVPAILPVTFDLTPLVLTESVPQSSVSAAEEPVVAVLSNKNLDNAPTVTVNAVGTALGSPGTADIFPPAAGTYWRYTYNAATQPLAGAFTFTAWAMDSTGHVDSVVAPTVDGTTTGLIIDDVAPVISGVATTGGATASASRFSAQPGFNTVQLTFDYQDAIDGPQAATVEAIIDGFLPGGAPMTMTCVSQSDPPDYACTYQASGTELSTDGMTAISSLDQAVLPIVITATDSVGNQVFASTSITFDFAPPAVGFVSVSYTPGVGNPVATPTAATRGTTITVQVAANEAIDPLQPVSMTATDAAGDVLAFAAAGAASQAGGTFQATVPVSWPSVGPTIFTPAVTWTDLVGNATASAAAPTTIVLQTEATSGAGGTLPPPDTTPSGPIAYTRIPWGSAATSGLPEFTITAGAGAAPGATALVAYDSPDLASASQLGVGAVDRTTGGLDGSGQMVLQRTDHAVIYLSAADTAGNLSPAVAAHTVSWTATFNSKVSGSTRANPHQMFSDVAAPFIPPANGPLGFDALATGVLSFDSLTAPEIADYAGLTSGSTATPVTVSSSRQWVQAGPVVALPGMDTAAMAFDARRGRTVLFTPLITGPGWGQTWEWDGTNWLLQSPVNSPGFRSEAALAYDAGRGVTVLFGGYGNVLLNDVWEWDGIDWNQRFPAHSPSVRFGNAMAYDSFRHVMVLFGGGQSAETWEWDGTDWTQRFPTDHPTGRDYHGMAYDPGRRVTVMFGGTDGSSTNYYGDTWEWDGTNWTNRSPTNAPGPRASFGMAYDAARGVTTLAGGCNGSYCRGTSFQDTWDWDGSNWVQQSPATTPPFQWAEAMAFDSLHGVLLMFDDQDGGLWQWNGNTWAERSPAAAPGVGTTDHQIRGPAMAWDSRNSVVVLFNSDGTTWLWNGLAWTQQTPVSSPPALWFHSMAYDSLHQKTILFGGWAGSAAVNDTWLWDGANWTEQTPSTRPPARVWSNLAYDSNLNEAVLFGGCGDLSCPNAAEELQDTWVWNGSNWNRKAPATSPPALWSAAMAYDAGHKKTVLFGGSGDSDLTAGLEFGDSDQTWLWDGADWTQQSPASSPEYREAHAMAYDSARGVTVMFGGLNASGVIFNDDAWEWDGQSWTNTLSTVTVPGRAYLAMAYDSARGAAVIFGGQPSIAGGAIELNDTWLWSPSPSLTALAGVELPAGLARFDFSATGESVETASLAQLTITASLGGTGYSSPAPPEVGTAVPGAFLAGWDTTAAGAWRVVTETFAAAATPASAPYSTTSPLQAASFALGGPSQSINLLVAPLHSPGNGGVPSQVAVQDLELTALYQHSESACVVTAGNPCACAADETQCGTGAPLCSDVNSDPNNCGACAESGGQVCRDGNWCIQGACQCPGAEVSCAGVCADTTADPANCGGCGLECPAATFCYQSLCYLDTAELINAASGRCLLAPGAAASATQLEISDCGQGSGENFYFYGGQLELNGACVDVAGSGTTPGTVVDLYPCTGNANQQWALEPAGEIVGVQSGMCLEAVQGATNNGALVDLNTCTGNTNQLWTWQ